MAELAKAYAAPTFLGFLLAGGSYAISLPLFLWMTPVLIGLVFAIPIVSLTSDPVLGARMRSAGILRTPEEFAPPAVLQRANAFARDLDFGSSTDSSVELLHDPYLLSAHLAMLPPLPGRRKGDIDVHRVMALAKIGAADNAAEALDSMTPAERFAALADHEAMRGLLKMTDGAALAGSRATTSRAG